MTTHAIRCRCGAVRGRLDDKGISNRIVCHCTDCRAFAHFLGQAGEMLDAHGGTEIVQVAQSRLRFDQGADRLATVRLSERGMIRWYAACCGTPIGNTLAAPGAAFIGLIHNCLQRERMDDDFGARVAIVNTDTALGTPKPQQRGLAGAIGRFIWIVVTQRIGAKYRQSPLFDAAGRPRVEPTILSAAELARLKHPQA